MLTGKVTDWLRMCWPASTIGWRKGPWVEWIERSELDTVQPAGTSRPKIPENFCGTFSALCYIHALSNGLDLAIQARSRVAGDSTHTVSCDNEEKKQQKDGQQTVQ